MSKDDALLVAGRFIRLKARELSDGTVTDEEVVAQVQRLDVPEGHRRYVLSRLGFPVRPEPKERGR